jgi:hypothetical protein
MSGKSFNILRKLVCMSTHLHNLSVNLQSSFSSHAFAQILTSSAQSGNPVSCCPGQWYSGYSHLFALDS